MISKYTQGISLIVLIITIVVIVILTGAIVLNLSNNNPIKQAEKAAFLNDIKSFQEQLDLYNSQKYVENNGNYDVTKLQVSATTATYNGATITGDIDSVKTTLASNKYVNKFKVVDGSLVYFGSDTSKNSIAVEGGIKVDVTGITGNLYTQMAPFTVRGMNTDVTLTEPGPILGTGVKTWKFVKDGTSSQWNGWEGQYGGIFDANIGDKWAVSGYYKSTNSAGISNFGIGFYTSDWSRSYNKTILSSDTKIVADGNWHYFYCIMQLNEIMTDGIIADGPCWTYSSQAGVMYINGLEWRYNPVGT